MHRLVDYVRYCPLKTFEAFRLASTLAGRAETSVFRLLASYDSITVLYRTAIQSHADASSFARNALGLIYFSKGKETMASRHGR